MYADTQLFSKQLKVLSKYTIYFEETTHVCEHIKTTNNRSH